MNKFDAYLSQQADSFESQLAELLRIPSVSADSKFRADTRRAAEWIAQRLSTMGLAPEVIDTAGHPLVYAETPPVPGAPVALVYGHYDVQPPDPLAEWTTPPFEPSIRNGNIYARGATDDKGQMLTHVLGLSAWLATGEPLPVQVKLLIEGEEEIGSPHLEPFVAEHRQKLAADVVVISDSSQFAPGVPAITYGLRGIAYYEIRLQGPQQDLHSGSFGGAVTNPANVLTELLASLKHPDGRIAIDGFYDRVVPLTQRERDEFARLPFDEPRFMQQLGVDGLTGEPTYTTLERRWARPTCDVNGLSSGYQGEGAKTVLPAKATAKVSFRLVPDQDPRELTTALQNHLQSRLPSGIKLELIDFHGAPGVVFPLDSPYMNAAATAIEAAFGTRPVFIREGGSIPIVGTFARELAADVLLLGWGLDDDNPHSPNEKFNLGDFHRGIAASAALWGELAKQSSAGTKQA
jgi:succinyl-diaminopimelate desuccinylase